MKIIELRAENVKRLSVVEIRPDGSLVIIGGKNGAGKSSVLDAIAYALGGRELICSEPLRKGKKRGKVVVDLGDLTITRTFNQGGGGQLKVEGRDGEPIRAPQTLLDDLVGRLSFDPLEFSRMKPAEQRETLREIVGLDFSAIDEERAALYDERREVNRTTTRLTQQAEGFIPHPDLPAKELSVETLSAELLEAQQAADVAHSAELDVDRANRARQDAIDAVGSKLTDIAEVELRLEELTHEADDLAGAAQGKADEARVASADLEKAQAAQIVGGTGPIIERLRTLQETNGLVRENAAHAETAKEAEAGRRQAESLTSRMDALDGRKEDLMAEAEFPVKGLTFDETGVLMEGVPFDQASSAEQLRVSLAMGLSANPKLKVILIRDGSLLDSDSLEMVAQMAEEADAQVWIERVGEEDATSVVIEDGAVRGAGGA